MAITFTSVDYYWTKFYQKENNSKSFLELSEEQLSIVSKMVYKMQEKMSTTLSKKDENTKYQKTLEYLTNPLIHLDLKTFDERIAYLIMMIDPNLVTFKEYLKIDLISMKEIDKIEDENIRNYLKTIRKQTISAYENTVREKIGFFDIKLLKYEEMFFNKFFNERLCSTL